MDYKELTQSYLKGKQVTVLFVILVSSLGLIVDALVYYSVYTPILMSFQLATVIINLVALGLILFNRKANYKLAYTLCVYSVIFILLATSLLYQTFQVEEGLRHTNVGLRDAYFLVIYLTVSGFIINRKHIVIQGILLCGLILYYTFYQKDPFFINNFFVNIVVTVGFICLCYFLVGSVYRFTDGLNQSVLDAEKRQKLNSHKTRKLESYQKALVGLTKEDKLYNKELRTVYNNICEIASKSLGVERVSIWILEEKATLLVRKVLYSSSTEDNEEIILKEKDYPLYFRSMQDKLFIKANNAFTHSDTKGFTKTYLEPLNICSMLDCLFRLDGEPVGVLCCETQGKFVEWTTEDVLFVQSLADYIAIANKNQQIKMLLEEIKLKNTDLEEKVKDNLAMNEELNALNEELMTVNEGLEKAVMDRTSTLQMQNEQLAEYAFINSHLLRAPIARILGLANIITHEVKLDKDKQMLEALHITTQELDEIVRKISDILYHDRPMSRADVKEMISRNMNGSN